MNVPAREVLWLFDLGNTSLKGRWLRGGELGNAVGMAWETDDPAGSLREMLATWPTPTRVLVASVASDERADHLRHVLQGLPRGVTEWLVTPRQACGITTGYRHPERLGIDRFLAMAGARAASHGAPFVIVGCGTALTLDAVDAQGRQGEGLIAPSPELMMRSLQAGTAIGDTNPDAFGQDSMSEQDDTHMAIYRGCWRAAMALVEAFHARHASGFGQTDLYLHGGGALTLHAGFLAEGGPPTQLLGDAVFQGLEVWAARLCDHP